MNASRIKHWFSQTPIHIVLIGICLIWLLPTIGLLVTSFRPFQEVKNGGWWTVLAPPTGTSEYTSFCSSCHGANGTKIATADLSNPKTIAPISAPLP